MIAREHQVIALPAFDIESIEVAAVGDPGQPCLHGQRGICGHPSSCMNGNYHYIVEGFCNGGSSNVCCSLVPGDPGMPCLGGKVGTCQAPLWCKYQPRGSSTVRGFCNGADLYDFDVNDWNICCLKPPVEPLPAPVKPPPAPVSVPVKGPGDAGMACMSGQDGTCGTASSCKTQTVSGHCNGGADNVCCLKTKPVTPPAGSNPWTVAVNSKNIVFNDFHPSGVKDEATAYREARDAAAGKPVT